MRKNSRLKFIGIGAVAIVLVAALILIGGHYASFYNTCSASSGQGIGFCPAFTVYRPNSEVFNLYIANQSPANGNNYFYAEFKIPATVIPGQTNATNCPSACYKAVVDLADVSPNIVSTSSEGILFLNIPSNGCATAGTLCNTNEVGHIYAKINDTKNPSFPSFYYNLTIVNASNINGAGLDFYISAITVYNLSATGSTSTSSISTSIVSSASTSSISTTSSTTSTTSVSTTVPPASTVSTTTSTTASTSMLTSTPTTTIGASPTGCTGSCNSNFFSGITSAIASAFNSAATAIGKWLGSVCFNGYCL